MFIGGSDIVFDFVDENSVSGCVGDDFVVDCVDGDVVFVCVEI